MENELYKERQLNLYINIPQIYSGIMPIHQEREKFNFIDENKKKILSFYSKFKYLCCKYKIDNLRKNHIDIIIKKVKIKLFKGIHEVLKYCLNININRLPQNFINNIKIEYNRQYLDKTISEIYLEFSILPSLKEILENKMIKKEKTEILILFMNSSLIDIIKIYLSSNLFVYDKKKLQRKSGLNDVILFDFVANNICDYFQYSSVSGSTITTNTNITNTNTKDELKNIVIDVDNKNRENNMSGNNVSKFGENN
jgi:hypothetical protein